MTSAGSPTLHPALERFAFLLGEWAGPGQGSYPTIEPFEYVERINFANAGKPFLAYSQRTAAADDGRPLHAETGYLRVPAPGVVELVITHPTGIEVDEGTWREDGDAIVIDLRSTSVGRTATAKQVDAIERTFRCTPEVITYDLRMAAVGQPMTHHLHAELRRH
jgi:hypothetical protein